METCLNPKSLPLLSFFIPQTEPPLPHSLVRRRERVAHPRGALAGSSALAQPPQSQTRGPAGAPPGSTRGSSASRVLRGSRPNPAALPAPCTWQARPPLMRLAGRRPTASSSWLTRATADAPLWALPPAPRASESRAVPSGGST